MTILSVLLRSAKSGVEKQAAGGAKVYRGVTTPMNIEGGGPWLKYTFNGNTVVYKPAHNDTIVTMFGMVKEKHEVQQKILYVSKCLIFRKICFLFEVVAVIHFLRRSYLFPNHHSLVEFPQNGSTVRNLA